jgi:hypothetical protein
MTRRRIERFLSTLAGELGRPARAFVTGAGAVALWGRSRPSVDIDLGVELVGRGQRPDWDTVQRAVDRTVRLTGIPANVAEDIDRWGMITLLDYRRSSRLYKRWGALEVRLLDPAHWAIGKLTRYLDSDVRDLVQVLRMRSVPPATAARIWGSALRASPASTTQFQFRVHVERFLTEHGRRIWGGAFDAAQVIRAFHRAARIVPTPSRTASVRGR